ncbi:MAG: GNAT family N-acyltransferase [Verrucomicrobiota bacterium]
MNATLSNNRIGRRILGCGSLRTAYRCRMAESAEDVKAAQTLRFLVFNVEMNEGLEQSYVNCRDEDPFDAVCDHLLVEEIASGDVIGTYRLQSGMQAAAHRGYYSAQEFDLSPFERVRGELVELGRACVHIQHRNLIVLGLLWQGIAAYAKARGARYLVGCSSLSSVDPLVGATAYQQLQKQHLVQLDLQTTPWPSLACSLGQWLDTPIKIPKLLNAYLSLGAKICGPPAVDLEFKTIDFLTLLDLQAMPEAVAGRILGTTPSA